MSPKKSKIDPELKARWVAELRSGKYVQGTGRLKKYVGNEDKICHCCLGVLCEIIAPEGFKEAFEINEDFTHPFVRGKSEQPSYPNQNKMKEIGLYPSAYKKLAQMNDGEGGFDIKKWKKNDIKPHNFEQIADYIEKNL